MPQAQAYNPLDELGGMLDDATKARLREEEETRKRDAINLQLKQQQLALDAAKEQRMTGGKPTEGDMNLERFGTTDPETIRAKKTQGGIYEEPKTLALRMQTDPDALRAELESQAAQKAPAQEHLYEATGPGGERYFTNKKALAHEGGATGAQEMGGSVGNGTFSNIGGGVSEDQADRDKATAALRRLQATPPHQDSDEVMRDVLLHRDTYKGLGLENGAEDAEATLTADALAGKVPMHAVAPISRMLSAGVREYNLGYGGGIPPDRTTADMNRLAIERMHAKEAEQKKVDDLTALKEHVEQTQPGGTLRPAVDAARQLANSEEANEPSGMDQEREYLESRGKPTPQSTPDGNTPNPEPSPSPIESEISRKRAADAKKKKGKQDAEDALRRRARDAGF